jgi:20S proteasome alpha/beta subunit
VTIIAGFKCDGGVVLCADTQETLSITKRNVEKLRVEPKYKSFSQHIAGIDLTVAFCGAGHGPFIDMLTSELGKAARACTTHDEAAEAMKARVEEVHARYREIYQDGSFPEVEILYAIRTAGQSSLYLAAGPVVIEKQTFECSGVGAHLANYIASRMYHTSMTLPQCVTLAAYILLQAKNHVEGCGGESHIAVLDNTGDCSLVTPTRVEAITNLAQTADVEAGRLVLAAGSLATSDSWFETLLGHYRDRMKSMRDATRDSLRSIEAMDLAIFAGIEAGLTGRPQDPDPDAFEIDDYGHVRGRSTSPVQLAGADSEKSGGRV